MTFKLTQENINDIIHGLNMVSAELGSRASTLYADAMFADMENDESKSDAFTKRADVYEDHMFRVEELIAEFEQHVQK